MAIDSINLNYNSRLTPSIQSEPPQSPPKNYTVGRVVKAFLPLVVMVGPVGRALELVGGTFSLYEIATSNEKNIALKALKITFHFTSIALLLVNPLAVSLIQNSWEVATKTHELGKCLINSDFKQASIHAIKVTEKCIFIASIVVGGPNIILISMVAQTALEAYRLSQFRQKGMYLETAVQAVVVGTRTYGIYKHIDSNKEYFQELCAKIQQKTNIILFGCLSALGASSSNGLMQSFIQTNNPQQQKELVDILCKYGNNPNIPALSKAIEAGDIGAVKTLLDYGADVNQRGSKISITVCPQKQQFTFTNDAKSALELSIEKNMINVIPLLLSKGADPYLIREVQYLEYNGKYHAHVQWKTTAVYDAIKSNKIEVIEIFKQYGVDFNKMCFYDLHAPGSKSTKPLQLALTLPHESHKKLITFLVENGAKL